MNTAAVDFSQSELVLIKKALDSYLSELRLEIVETKHDKKGLHDEEELVKGLIKKIS
jgi:phage-related minor tail protein